MRHSEFDSEPVSGGYSELRNECPSLYLIYLLGTEPC